MLSTPNLCVHRLNTFLCNGNFKIAASIRKDKYKMDCVGFKRKSLEQQTTEAHNVDLVPLVRQDHSTVGVGVTLLQIS